MTDILSTFMGKSSRVRIGELTVDAVLEENHELEAEGTEHPVEDGSTITDHIHVKTPPLSMRCAVTLTPIGTKYPGQTAVDSISRLIAGDNPIGNAWRLLTQYLESREIIDISTTPKTYYSMYLSRISWRRIPEESGGLYFDLVANPFKITHAESIKKIPIPRTKSLEKEKSKGNKGKKKVTDVKKKESIGHKFGQKLKEFASVYP